MSSRDLEQGKRPQILEREAKDKKKFNKEYCTNVI